MIGTKLAHYEITGHLGAGGMGEVYQATDTKLGRSVAIKLLPEVFAHDAERVARFEREARVLASLNHPNIAAIYGVEEFGDRKFLVMELVSGGTLAERIKRGPIPLKEALGIARQITQALEAAHGKGIVHRDVKAANINMTANGQVKVLDFGLAKIRDTPDADLSNSPTMTSTSPGMILGTAAYMSPEQARGQEADHTADVWAFGCLLYEMLTGRHVFEGATVGEILGEVFKGEPEWRRLPAETPASIRRLLRRCLQKERDARLRDIADARLEIDEAQAEPPAADAMTPAASQRRERLLWAALALVTLLGIATTVRAFRPTPQAPETRVDIMTPPTRSPASLAISPDGRKIVFEATTETGSLLWLRSLDSVSAQSLAGTENPSLPFWSPDSQSVGFFAESKLKRIDINTGSVQTLADATLSPMGGAWNRDGKILFVPSLRGGMFRVPDTGGDASQAKQEGSLPQFLPDGLHFLFLVTSNRETSGVYVGQVDGPDRLRLFDTPTAAVVASSGQILYVREGTLFAQDFDARRLALTGKPSTVAERVAISADGSVAAVSASATGSIVFRTGSVGSARQLIWFDRTGREIGKVGDLSGSSPSLSPDGRLVALVRNTNGINDIWLLETARGALSRFTSDPAGAIAPLWSPDGRRIVFSSIRTGVVNLYQKSVTGGGAEEPLLETPNNKLAADWSLDGKFLLYRNNDPKTSFDLLALPIDASGKPGKSFPVVQTTFGERDGQFSPDGKWIAYESNRSGRSEIYVHPFPGPGREWQISINGGAQVRWRNDGKELFYIALDRRLMVVPIRLTLNAQAVDADPPVPLFLTHVGDAVPTIASQQYIVSPDGQRFLMSTVVEEATSRITLILNWKP